MYLHNKKTEDNESRKWVCTLQEKFGLNTHEANELHTHMCTCFAHNFNQADVERVIYGYVSQKGHAVVPDDIVADSVFAYRAGGRRYSKWSWQENAFGILAYLLTILFFWFDILSLDWEQSMVAFHQFFAVIFVSVVWYLFDRWSRGRPWAVILFDAVNRFMPGVTLITYLVFHLCKWMYYLKKKIGWFLGMKAVVAAYMGLGIWLTVRYLLQYRKVVTLKRIAELSLCDKEVIG